MSIVFIIFYVIFTGLISIGVSHKDVGYSLYNIIISILTGWILLPIYIGIILADLDDYLNRKHY